MARSRGHMITKDISNSQGIAQLSPQALALFALLIPHYNGHGKMNGGPGYVKDEVCPLIPWLTIQNIPKYLQEISDNTNVKWFKSGGRQWLHSLNFLSEHQNLNPDRIGQDLLPSYSGASLPEVEEEEEVEDGSRSASARKLAHAVDWNGVVFAGITDEMKTNWHIAYPAVDLDRQIAAAAQWLIANPAKSHKASYYRYLVNWFARQQERGGDIGSNKGENKPRLPVLIGKTCCKCGLPAVYKAGGDFDNFYCLDHSPAAVRAKYA